MISMHLINKKIFSLLSDDDDEDDSEKRQREAKFNEV